MKINIARASMVLLLGACGSEADDDSDFDDLQVPATYAFESRFTPGQSSVAYAGQTFRFVQISEIDAYLVSLTASIDEGSRTVSAGDIRADLEFFFDYDPSVGAGVPLTMQTQPPLMQTTFGEAGGSQTLASKIAGEDAVGQHEDWSTELVGLDPGLTPLQVVRQWFDEVDALAVDRTAGVEVLGPDGTPVSDVFVTADGRDLRQLIQKFITGAVAYSQAADDYLDDDTDGKGLRSSNEQDGDATYSALEHQWDEGFGYFGAARDYLDYTDEEIAGRGGRADYAAGYHDSNGDGRIDLQSEFNFGHSTNAAKRDLGAQVQTDYTADAMRAFLEGRAIITSAEGELDDAQRAALEDARDRVLLAWERSIAATAVHYINDTLQDMAAFGTDDYAFETHAKHWSELKGFALVLQFSPRSTLSDAELLEVHQLLGSSPVLPSDTSEEVTAYRDALLDARGIIGRGFGFAAANLGDASGMDGW